MSGLITALKFLSNKVLTFLLGELKMLVFKML